MRIPSASWLNPTVKDFEVFELTRLRACDFWGHLIWVGAARATPETEFLVKQLLDRAAWAATEVSKDAPFKYGFQRYASMNAMLKLEEARSGRIPPRVFTKNVRHEHVFTKKEVIPRLRVAANGESDEAVIQVLRGLVACVVTEQEGTRLNEYATGGWERYRKAEIEVWDRKNCAKLILPGACRQGSL